MPDIDRFNTGRKRRRDLSFPPAGCGSMHSRAQPDLRVRENPAGTDVHAGIRHIWPDEGYQASGSAERWDPHWDSKEAREGAIKDARGLGPRRNAFVSLATG